MRRNSRIALAVAAVCMSFSVTLRAAPFLWDGGAAGSPNWTDPTNWNPDGNPANNGTADITFGGAIDVNVNVDSAQDVLSLTFNSTAGAFSIGGPGQLTIRAGGITNNDSQTQSITGPIVLGAAQSWNTAAGALIASGGVNNGGFALTFSGPSTAIISGAFSGAGELIKSSTGTLTLSGSANNTYTGLTTVNSGTLQLSKTGSATAITGNLTIGDGLGATNTDIVRLGASNQIADTSTLTFASSGRLDLNGFADTIGSLVMTGGNLVGAGASELGLGGSLTTLTSTLSSNITVPTIDLLGVPHSFNIAEGTDLRITGALINGGIVKNQRGFIFLAGTTANSLSGVTTVNEGSLILGKSAGVDAINGAGLAIGEGALPFIDAVFLAADSQIADSTPVSVGPAGRLDLNGFNDNIAQLGITGGAVVTGAGRLGVTGVATGNSSQTATISGNLGLLGAARTFNIADGSAAVDLDVSASVQDGDLIKTGPGTMRLSGAAANTHGLTTVNNGTLVLDKAIANGAIPGDLVIADGSAATVVRLQQPNQINDTSSIHIHPLGALDLNNHSDIVGNIEFEDGGTQILTGTGTLRLSGNVFFEGFTSSATIVGNVDLLGGTRTFDVTSGTGSPDLNVIANLFNGTLVKTGLGELQLGGNNSISVFLQDGTLRVASNTALGGGGALLEDGVLQAVGARTLANPMNFTGPVIIDGPDNLTLTGGVNGLGSLRKLGSGTLALTNSSPTNLDIILDDGTLHGPDLRLGGLGSLTMNSGTFSGTLRNGGAFIYNGGQFDGTLINDATFTINTTGFQPTAGMSNFADVTINNGVLLAPGGTGLFNSGQISMAGGTITANAINNSGSIIGFGDITSSGGGPGFVNNGLIIQSGGNLGLGNSTSLANNGNIDLAAGRTFSIFISPLQNRGTINLNGGLISGTHALNNLSGGTIAGRGSILIPLTNNGGLILVQNGTTNIAQAFSSGGTIQLAGIGANLVGGQITNFGTIQGAGSIGSMLDSSGTIEAIGGTLILASTVNNFGTISASTGNKVLVTAGLDSQTGIINLTGGTFENIPELTNQGQISGYGTFRAAHFINDGTMTFSGGVATINGNVTNNATRRIEVAYSPAIFTGDVINNGIFKNTDTTITFAGTYTENGTFLSDPADNLFTDVSIGAAGAWVGGYGDRFIISGNLLSESAAKSAWQTSQAELRFTGGIEHILSVMGDDLGITFAGYDDNFAWRALSLGAGDSLVLDDVGETGGALYVRELHLAGGISQISNIESNGLSIYYDLGNPANAYLGGQTYALSGGGTLSAVPEPGILYCLLVFGCVAAARRRKVNHE